MADPDYEMSITGSLIATQQPQTLTAVVTVGVNLRQIAIEAAQAAGMNIRDVTVETRLDASDELAHFFSFDIPPGEQVSGNMRSRLLRELRDRLLARGVSIYPYTRLTSS